MIKNFSNIAKKYDNDVIYKNISHIITSLYKIKTINRKIIYTNEELKKLVSDSPIGKQVVEDLKLLGVSQSMLIDYDLLFFNSIVGDQFPEY